MKEFQKISDLVEYCKDGKVNLTEIFPDFDGTFESIRKQVGVSGNEIITINKYVETVEHLATAQEVRREFLKEYLKNK